MGWVLDFFPQLSAVYLTNIQGKKKKKRLLVDHNREHQDYKHSLTRTEVLIDMEVRKQNIIQCKIKSEINRLTKWLSLQLHEKIRGSTIQQLKKKEKENWEPTMFHFDKNPCGDGEKKMSQISACGIHETVTRNISWSLWENGRDNFLHVVIHAEPISPKRHSEVKGRCRIVRLRLMPQDHQLVMLEASAMT